MPATNVSHEAKAEEAPELERLRDEVRREHEMYLRALADFDNYRRRVERDRASATESGKRALLLSMLDVVDNFERALEHLSGAPELTVEGLEALNRKLAATLESHGVTSFRSLGEPFDPARHEAVGTVQDA